MTQDNNDTADTDAEGFSEAWLSLREPADHAARSAQLSSKLVHWGLQQEALQVVDLGAGTGSNLRYLMPVLGHDQHWRLIDHDTSLLERLPEILQPWTSKCHASIRASGDSIVIEHPSFSAHISTEVVDLANNLHQLSLNNAHLLTASALLDLTSATWLDKLAKLVQTHHCACLFVLNYNGSIRWQPELPSDANITALLNQHQLGDKGFGPALGPSAGLHMASKLKTLGRTVEITDSDWHLDKASSALQQAIAQGWAPAALEQDSTASVIIEQWLRLRQQNIENGQSELSVGHIDLLSLP